MSHLFQGRKAILATRHEKERVIAPIMLKECGVEVVVPDDFDTDQFGTFTRDIQRQGSQLEAARKKALTAMKQYGFDLGIASEGSFGADPHLPFIQTNTEVVILIDTKNNLEIVGYYRSSHIKVFERYVSSPSEAVAVAQEWGFPDHGVVVRLNKDSKKHIYKDVVTLHDVERYASLLFARPFVRKIFLESDMRAHRHPTRMKHIERAVYDLVNNINSCCPHCDAPGFVAVDIASYAPCSACGMYTDIPKTMLWRCQRCSHTVSRAVLEDDAVDPGLCERCNP